MRLHFFNNMLFILIFYSLHSQIEVFFSPEDRPAKKLIAAIDEAKNRIFAAIYTLTHKDIAAALVRAKARNVDVRIVLDKFSLESPWGKAITLQAAGIKILLRSNQVPAPIIPSIQPAENQARSFDGLDETVESAEAQAGIISKKKRGFNREPLMHNKYAIIDEQIWTGSFNWTVAADTKNQENALFIKHEAEVVARFLQNFKKLEENSTLLDAKVISSMRKEIVRSPKMQKKAPEALLPKGSPATPTISQPAVAA